MTRDYLTPALALLLGCHGTGASGAAGDTGVDGSVEDATSAEGAAGDGEGEGDEAEDAAVDAEAAGACFYSGNPAAPSSDCVFVGVCPLDCFEGTASEYACVPPSDAGAGAYPAVFALPIGYIEVVSDEDAGYPWMLPASLACAPLGCVRWATADHGDGGSAWPGDPCADAGSAVEAWACPPYPGLTPPASGCVNAGEQQAIGGAGSGIPTNSVWCCDSAGAD